MTSGKIVSIAKGSLAEELELVVGDRIIEINGQPLRDIIDFSFAFADEEIDMLLEHENGEQELLSFEKDCDEELGVEFETAVFDGIRRCANNCCFCFVDQVPPAMRSSLYVKDDDYRLSFLYSNFVTLTNMADADFDRIKRFHLTPLYVSVHTMNMELREKMLRSNRAGRLIEQLNSLERAGVDYHAQIVLCPGLNDGDELDYTISELLKRRPHVQSMAVVPVGLTKYREGCYPLKMFDGSGAAKVIDQVEKWQKKERQKTGETCVYLADEFYLLAGRALPEAEEYGDYPQLGNGIGLLRNFIETWNEADGDDGEGYALPTNIVVVSGTAAAPTLAKLVGQLNLKNLAVKVLPVKNEFFGDMVNVSGLLTGRDIVNALKAEGQKFNGAIVPECAVRMGKGVFLDDYLLTDMRKQLPMRIMTALSGGRLRYLLTHWYEIEKGKGQEKVYTWQGNAAYTQTADGKG